MQSFVIAKEYLIFFGIVPIPKDRLPPILQHYQNVINRVQIGIFIVLLVLSSLSSIFAMQLENENTPEAILFDLCFTFLITLYSIFVWKGSKMVDLMTDLNELIEKRKSNAFKC